MTPLQINLVYRLDLTDRVQFGPVKKQVLYERFTDGRISGLLAEDLANALYSNIMKSPTEKSSYDLMDDDGRKYECRTVTQRGVNLLPSNQIGKGRQKDEAKFKEKLSQIYAYVFIDIRDSPIFKIVAVPVDDLHGRDKLNPSQFVALIGGLPETLI